MKEPSNTNPEFIFNFKLIPRFPTIKLKHSIIVSSCDSELNPQIVGNINTQDSEYMSLKSSEMINRPCSKPTVSNMINFECISQVLIKEVDYDTIASFHLNGHNGSTNLSFAIGMGTASWIISHCIGNFYDYCSRNLIRLSKKIWRNGGSNSSESGRSDASLLPKPSCSNRYCISVRKSTDANSNTDANTYNSAENEKVDGKSGLLPTDNDDEEDMDDDDKEEEVNGVEILQVHIHNAEVIEMLLTHLIANRYDSWDTFAEAIYGVWRKEYGNGNANAPEIVADMDPSRCWPGSSTVFGRLKGEKFTNLNWPEHPWQSVRVQINCLRVYATATVSS